MVTLDKIVKDSGEPPAPRLTHRAATGLRTTFTGHAAHALRTGSGVLARRGWNALPDDGVLTRLGYLAVGGYVAAYSAVSAPDPAAPFIAPGLALGWCVAAWCVAPPAEPEDEPDDDGEQPEPEPIATPDEVRAATLEWIRQQVADRNGIHLSALLTHAHAHEMLTDVPDVPAFRAVLDRWDIPVRRSVKVAGQVAYGIHRNDLPAPSPGEAPTTDP